MGKSKNFVMFAEKNIHGAWTVYGANGVRQYYGYSKREAIQRYNEEASGKIIICKPKKGGE